MFTFRSPTVENWLKIIGSQRAELLNTRRQMTVLLQAVRNDVDSQFDEKQTQWQDLAPYTVKKKAEAGSDPRILHETKLGQGLRLRDAYRQVGRVDDAGLLIYTYPLEKPYAIEHQEGRASDKDDGTKKKGKMNRHLARRMADLDKEYDDIFGRG